MRKIKNGDFVKIDRRGLIVLTDGTELLKGQYVGVYWKGRILTKCQTTTKRNLIKKK